MANVTELLNQANEGEPGAADRLIALVYDELRRLAAARLAHERPGQTLDATALVHESYLRLVGDGPGPSWEGRAHFFGAAAEAMRRILIERARRKQATRHGGGRRRVDLDAARDLADEGRGADLLALDEALAALATEHPGKAELVKLRYFGGLTLREAAETLGVSLATAERHWAFARSWLYDRLASESDSGTLS